jgi:hypothetical protein
MMLVFEVYSLGYRFALIQQRFLGLDEDLIYLIYFYIFSVQQKKTTEKNTILAVTRLLP